MTRAANAVTISVPRSTLSGIARLSPQISDRMHELLERNTDGDLNKNEKAELKKLVQIAELSQIAAMALKRKGRA